MNHLIDNHPNPIIILAFTFQNTFLLQSREVTFDGALAHRQSFRHLSACYCRRFFDEIEDFLLTLSEFCLRHVSVMVSDIRGVGRGKNDGLELGWSRFEHRLQFFSQPLLVFDFTKFMASRSSMRTLPVNSASLMASPFSVPSHRVQ